MERRKASARERLGLSFRFLNRVVVSFVAALLSTGQWDTSKDLAPA